MIIHYLFKILNFFSKRLKQFESQEIKKRLKRCGKGVLFLGKTIIDYPINEIIGDNVSFHDIEILGRGNVIIGDFCHFGNHVKLITQNHNYLSDNALPYDDKYIIKDIQIGQCVWIGDNVLMTPGVNIGEGAIIGMGSVVSKDVPPLAIVGGNPIQILNYRDEKTYSRLKKEEKFH